MRTVEIQVYKFEELSDTAKAKAREWWQENANDDFASEVEYEQYETAARLIGLEFGKNERKTSKGAIWYELDIAWSGFSSQGDGASFTGTYAFKPGCSETVRAEFGTDKTLWAIADKLTVMHGRLRLKDGTSLEGKITRHSSHYSHSHTMGAVVFDKDGEELEADLCDEFRDIMREFADWIYKGLEAEYDYRLSDEAADEALEGNDYEFDEDGELV